MRGAGRLAGAAQPLRARNQDILPALPRSASPPAARLPCESDTHILLPHSRIHFTLNDVAKRICLFSFFPIVVLFFSRKKMRVSSAEIHQMWARRISPIKLQSLCHPPIGNSTGLIIWYHVSTFFFQKLSSSYFVPFK